MILDDSQRAVRSAVRAFLLTATVSELWDELILSLEQDDLFRARCVVELIDAAS